jgi:hypothetical protein
MKFLFKVFVTIQVMFLYSCVVERPVAVQQGNVSFQVFYDELNPYGQWANNPNYGYIWIPDAGNGFSPYYTNGYWVMTEYGWTWTSGYSWGWAPFHYGRWDYDNHFGWFWVPDNEWGPSWVIWRSTDNYYGWTPMRPSNSATLSYSNGYGDINHWNIVKQSDFGKHNMPRYYISNGDKERMIRNSTVINNTYKDTRRNVTYVSGPQRDAIKKSDGREIKNIPVRDNDKPGEKLNNKELQIYRPHVERNSNTYKKPVPPNVTEIKDIKPPDQRNGYNRRNSGSSSQNRENVEKQKKDAVNSSNSGNNRTKEESTNSAEKTKKKK